MGKNGKLRKKRRLENAIQAEDSGSDEEDTSSTARKTAVTDPLSSTSVENAVRCLEYYGKCFDRYQTADNKLLRTCLFPLINEQKSKSFNPAMHTTNLSLAEDDVEPDSSLHDLHTAIATFRALGNDLDVFRSKDLKLLRRALYPIVVATRSASGLKDHSMNISGEISDAMNLRRWDIVFHKLLEMKKTGNVPKLGALQRWVRQCGDIQPKELAIFLLSRIIDLTAATTLLEQDMQRLTESYRLFAAGDSASPGDGSAQLVYLPPFLAAHRRGDRNTLQSTSLPELVPIGKDSFEIDSCVLGKDRRPPSNIDMNIYRSKKDAITFDRLDANQPCVCHMNQGNHSVATGETAKGCEVCRGVYRDEVEGVKGAILLSNVLSSSECETLVRCAEMLGYYDDAVEGIEALVWLADKSLLQPIFDRCRNLLPQQVANGKKVTGINPRLRFFRYQKGAVYRPHIDGSWTANGDASLASHDADEIHSYYTFLFYLNDDFTGGGTTFFVAPSSEQTASDATHGSAIVAHTVQPIRGSVLCFPHGVVEGSLVHEGSAVVGDGRKYVIRTDLMFA